MSFGKTNYRVGGTRGGADQFKWEDVKNDKYRENYLGHSVQAPVGRWQKGKDLTWYAKANKSQRAEALQAELALAKQRDEDLMNEALGIAPKKRREPVEGLSASEMKELLKRGEAERDGMDVERVEGLGAAPVEAEGFETGSKRTLAERYKDQIASGKADTTYALPGTVNDQMSESEVKAARKEARKAEKAVKKLKKKEKKERKKEKKEKRHHDSDEQDDDKQRHHQAEIPLGTFTLPVDTASDDLDLVHAHQLIVIGMRARPDALRYQRTPVAVRGPQPDPRADTVAIATGHLLHLQLVGNTPARVLDLATVTSQAYCVIRENT
ncbi:hypothetical protein PC113_g5869 [Phytophthora cactorum]|uniref:Multiple myeloma tumor-associated protein 2-like N-terminal domain-containing protein n=1 Tax=Phytophthora cactorum TaxID=29920 RepID=A0A8T0ZLR9_9STRA|nr:hypothetical protein PC113_g5869 [Phytophthora cactorum]